MGEQASARLRHHALDEAKGALVRHTAALNALAVKLLILCEQGNNRSVTLAHQLKYLGHDVLSAGLETNSEETLKLLCDWADRVITTDKSQRAPCHDAELWHIGPDHFPRPFNKQLLAICRSLVAANEPQLETHDPPIPHT